MTGTLCDGAALLRSVLEAPDDDAPRLVYADWLDEQGDGELAHLLRSLTCKERLEFWRDYKFTHGLALREYKPLRDYLIWCDVMDATKPVGLQEIEATKCGCGPCGWGPTTVLRWDGLYMLPLRFKGVGVKTLPLPVVNSDFTFEARAFTEAARELAHRAREIVREQRRAERARVRRDRPAWPRPNDRRLRTRR